MATIGLNANEQHLHDDFENFSFDDFNFEVQEPEDSRHPVMKTLAPMGRGAKDYITNSDNIERFVKSAMPKGYGQAYDLGQQAKGELKQLYNNAAKEIKPVKDAAKSVLRKTLPSLDGKIPKGLKKKLEEFSKEEEQWQGREGDGREEQLGSLLSSIFEQRAKDDVTARETTNEREKLNQGFEQIRHRDQVSQLDAIRLAVEAQTQYQNKIGFNVQKKQLELSYRMFWALADLNKEQKKSNAEVLTELKATRINTGLPDYVKQRTMERFKEQARNKFLDQARDGMFGSAQDYFKKFSKNLGDQAMTKLRSITQPLSAMGDMAGSAADMTAGMGDMPGMNMRDELIQMAMSLPMDYLADKGSRHLNKILGKNKAVRRGGAAAGRFAGTISDRINEQLTSNTRDWGKLEGLRGLLAGAVPSAVPDSKMQVDSLDRRHEGVPFARSNSKSLDEIIPGLLARIHREIKILRTGDENAELITYDFTKNRFSTEKKVASELRQRIAGNHTERATKYADSILKKVNRGGKLSEEQLAKARKTLVEKAVMGETIDIRNIATADNWGGGEDGEAISGAFNRYLRASDGKLSHNEQSYRRQIDLMQRHRGIVGGIGDPRVLMQQMTNAGQFEQLQDMGILDKTGSVDRKKYAEWLLNAQAQEGGPTPGPAPTPVPPSTTGTPPPPRRVTRTRNGGRNDQTPQAGPTPTPTQGSAQPSTVDLRQLIRSTDSMSERQADMLNELRNITAALRDRETPQTQQASTVESNVQKIVDALVALDAKYEHVSQANYSTLDAMLQRLTEIATNGVRVHELEGPPAPQQQQGPRGFTSLWEHFKDSAGRNSKKAWGQAKRGATKVGQLWEQYSPPVTTAIKKVGGEARVALKDLRGKLEGYYGDVVVSGERYPRLRANLLRAGEYRDKVTGRVITSLEDITGDVVDASGNLVITMDEFYNSYVTGSLNKKVKELFANAKSKLEDWKESIQGYVPGAIARTKARISGLMNKVKQMLPPYDVYVKSDMTRPLLYANMMRYEMYFSQRTGKTIKHPRDIDGPVVDERGNVVLSEDHLREGIVDIVGDPAGPGLGRLGRKLGRKVTQAWETMRDAAIGIFGAVGKGLGNVSEYFKNFFMPFGEIITNSGKTVTLLEKIHALLDDRMPGGKKVRGDADGDGVRDGSIEDIRRKRKEAEQAIANGEGADGAKAPGGIVGKLMAGLSGLMSKRKKEEDEEDEEDEDDGFGLEDVADLAEVGDFMNGDGGGRDSRGERGSKKRKKAARDRLKRMRKAQKAREAAARRGGRPGLGRRALNAAGRVGRWGGFNTDLVRGAGRAAAPVVGGAARLGGAALAGTAGLVGAGARGLAGNSRLAQAARWGMFNTDVVRGAGKLAGGAMKLAPRALGVAGTAYSAYSAYNNIREGNYGEAALDAGLGLGGLALTTGGVAGLMGAGGAVLGGIGAVLASPVLVPALAVAAAGALAYAGYKWMKKTKLTPMSKVRLAQYGIDSKDSDSMGKVFALESMLEEHAVIKDGKVHLDPKKVDLEEISNLFDVKSKHDLPLFNAWYNRRFIPVWGRWLGDARKVQKDAELSNIEKVVPGKDKVKFIDSLVNGLTDIYTYMAGWAQNRPRLDLNGEGVKAVADSVRTELMKDVERDGGAKAVMAPRSTVAASPAEAGKMAEKALNDTANYVVKDKAGKVLDANALGFAALREKISKGEVTVDVAAAIPKEVAHMDSSRLDALTSIRYKAYGLTHMSADKARMLSALEMFVGDQLSGDLENPKLKMSSETVMKVAGEVFGVTDPTSEHGQRWLSWYNGRFLPVFLIWSGTIRKKTAKEKLGEASKAFPMIEQVALARAIIGAKGRNSFGANTAVWNVGANPWADNYELNADPDSTAGNLEAIRVVADKVKLGEITATNGKTHKVSKEVSDFEKNGWLGKAKSAVGNFFGMDMSKKGEGVQASGDKITKANPDAKPLPGIGDPLKFGSNPSGNFTELPTPSGTGWGATRDLITKAAHMAGVDPKALIATIAVESGFDPNASPKNPNLPSSAKGLGQHLDDSWLEDLKLHGKKFGIPNGTNQFDARASALMTASRLKYNGEKLQKMLGRPVTVTDIYLAHLMGLAGATKFLKSPEDAIGAEVAVSSAKQHPNYFYAGGKALTVKEVYAKFAEKLAKRPAEFGVTTADLKTVGGNTATSTASTPAAAPSSAPAQASGPTKAPAGPGSSNAPQAAPKAPAPSYANTPSAGSPRLNEPVALDKGKGAVLSDSGTKPLPPGLNYELVLQREDSEEDGTYGTLRLPDGTVLNTLELPWKNNQSRVSCIPPGSYKCKKRGSATFGSAYEVMSVPARTAILIHAGNAAGSAEKGMKAHSQGCILLGMDRGRQGSQKVITASKAAMKLFHEKMADAPFTLVVRPGKNNTAASDPKAGVSFDPVRQPAASAAKPEASQPQSQQMPSVKTQGPRASASQAPSTATSSDLPRLNTTQSSIRPGGPTQKDMQQRDAAMADVIAPKLDGLSTVLGDSLIVHREGVGVLKKILEAVGGKAEQKPEAVKAPAPKVRAETSSTVPVPQRRNF